VTLEAHPVADMFPMMSADELQGLIEDIRTHGLREPIWLHPDGRIVDGRNRYKACLEGAVRPRFRTWDANGSLADFVLSLNLHRRHLSQSQKAVIALRVEEQYATEAKERMADAGRRSAPGRPIEKGVEIVPPLSADDGKARERAGKAVGVSGRYVQDAKRLADEAPDLVAAVESGEMSLPKAKEEMQRRSPTPPSRKVRSRQPLPEFAQKAGWELRKRVDAVERIFDDDRFSQNRVQVATHLRGHLTHTVEVFQDLLDRLNHTQGDGNGHPEC